MLYSFKDLNGFTLGAIDGEIGKVKDVYFDDHSWAVRYLVVHTGGWLSGRNVLITPLSIRMTEWDDRKIDVSLTRQQVGESPDIDTERPVSRQHESVFLDYYRYPYYWTGPFLWGALNYPAVSTMRTEKPASAQITERSAQAADPQLRSGHEVTGYHIEALDGGIGHVEDFLIDGDNWSIHFIAVDTRNFWPGKHVLIEPAWIERVSWSERKAHVRATRESIRESPEYDPILPWSTDYEARLRRHYEHLHR